MKQKILREVIVTYCDYCGNELTNSNHSSIIYPDGRIVDLCSTYNNKITETCQDKYRKEEREKS